MQIDSVDIRRKKMNSKTNILYDVSVVILSYKPNIDKLRYTINSVLLQKNVSVEIIIADDGSGIDYINQIDSLIKSLKAHNIKCVFNKENRGTCHNYYSGVLVSSAKYIKILSPGDYLFETDTLSKWIEFLNNNHIAASFGNCIYYRTEHEKIQLVQEKHTCPYFPYLFTDKNNKMKTMKLDYLIAKDYILGASVICEKRLLLNYLSMLVGRVKYAEDMMYRLVVLQDIPLVYYNKNVIWYESGTGISTTGNSFWIKRLQEDDFSLDRIAYEILNSKCKKTFFDKRFLRLLLAREKKGGKLISYIIFPEAFYWKIKQKLYGFLKKSTTSIDADLGFISMIIDYGEDVKDASS